MGDTELIFRESCLSTTCPEFPIADAKNLGYAASLSPGQSIKLDIIIKNPNQSQIYSVSSWIKYDPKVFQAKDLSKENSAFPLEAPGEFEIDALTGEVKMGRAVLGTPVTTPEIFVASVSFTVLKNPINSVISFMDYQSSDVGKTAVLTIENLITKNILLNEPKSLKFLQGQGGAVPSSSNSTTPKTNTSPVGGPFVSQDPIPSAVANIPDIPSFVDIPRPEGFRARTDEAGKLEFIWQFGEDPRIAGYYLYYDELSGSYIHRRDMGRTNNYTIPAGFLEKGKRYYFAIRAYDAKGKLSDFSDEVYLVVGVTGSESHPFFGILAGGSSSLSLPSNLAANVAAQKRAEINAKRNAETGPFDGVYLILMISGGLLILLALWRGVFVPVFFSRKSP
ncbi:MAG: cohesin domain-containing protein [Candidatus Peregrinibacteria bacterium]